MNISKLVAGIIFIFAGMAYLVMISCGASPALPSDTFYEDMADFIFQQGGVARDEAMLGSSSNNHKAM